MTLLTDPACRLSSTVYPKREIRGVLALDLNVDPLLNVGAKRSRKSLQLDQIVFFPVDISHERRSAARLARGPFTIFIVVPDTEPSSGCPIKRYMRPFDSCQAFAASPTPPKVQFGPDDRPSEDTARFCLVDRLSTDWRRGIVHNIGKCCNG